MTIVIRQVYYRGRGPRVDLDNWLPLQDCQLAEAKSGAGTKLKMLLQTVLGLVTNVITSDREVTDNYNIQELAGIGRIMAAGEGSFI